MKAHNSNLKQPVKCNQEIRGLQNDTTEREIRVFISTHSSRSLAYVTLVQIKAEVSIIVTKKQHGWLTVHIATYTKQWQPSGDNLVGYTQEKLQPEYKRTYLSTNLRELKK